MGVWTLVRYLLGDRNAILTIASNRHALAIGYLFVLSAGFAREYDGEDLLHEPWYLLAPLGASLASSFLLFSFAYGVAIARGEPWRAFFPRYLSFLSLFWMTAPLAWLYAVPYERFLSPYHATMLNLITLGVVSLWRVALVVRVLCVLFGFSVAASAGLVMLFANALALFLLFFLPFPLVDVMGGVRYSEGERLTRKVAGWVFMIGGFGLPSWLVVSCLGVYFTKAKWHVADAPHRVSPGLLVLAGATVLAWAVVLPFTQPEQQRRRAVERAYNADDLDGALALASAHPQEAFPPHWTPPCPREMNERWVEIVERLAADEVADWVRQRYLRLVCDQLRKADYAPEPTLRALGLALLRMPEGRAIVEELRAELGNQSGKPWIMDAVEGKLPKDRSAP